MRRLVSVVFVVVVMACGVGGAPEVDDVATTRQSLDAVTGFGSNPGNLLMYRFVPTGLARGRPLVVLLHGCGETATTFSTSSGFEAQATQRQFALVLPQQQFLNNVQTCFNWFEAANQQRDSDELLSIKQMVDRMVTDVGSDPQQVYIAGFSAGAAQVANLLATSPDRFRAGAMAAGIPFECTTSVLSSQTCLSGLAPQTPQVWAMRVRAAFPSFTGTYPRVAVWQGQSDVFVAPSNGPELVKQWTGVHGIDQTADGTQPITSGGTRTFFRASAGSVALVELNEVPGLGHAWRSAWATDIADFFGLSAATASDGGTAGGSAGGGSAAAGGAAGGGVAGGGVAGGGSATAGGVASAGGTAGGNSAGGASTAGGSAAAGGSASAGGSAAAGGAAGGATSQPMGCQSCNSAGGSLSLALVLLLRRRMRAGHAVTTGRSLTPAASVHPR